MLAECLWRPTNRCEQQQQQVTSAGIIFGATNFIILIIILSITIFRLRLWEKYINVSGDTPIPLHEGYRLLSHCRRETSLFKHKLRCAKEITDRFNLIGRSANWKGPQGHSTDSLKLLTTGRWLSHKECKRQFCPPLARTINGNHACLSCVRGPISPSVKSLYQIHHSCLKYSNWYGISQTGKVENTLSMWESAMQWNTM